MFNALKSSQIPVQIKSIEFLFGGSFDPVHFGHLNVIKCLQKLNREWPIRVLPCGAIPALKQPLAASFEHRMAMLKLALQGFDNVIIDPRENATNNKSYSINSLQALKAEVPERKLVMVLGEDTILQIKKWHLADKLADYCHLIIVNRPGKRVDNLCRRMTEINFKVAEKLNQLELTASGSYYSLRINEKAIASSAIKQRLSTSESVDGMLPAQVKQYITENLLY